MFTQTRILIGTAAMLTIAGCGSVATGSPATSRPVPSSTVAGNPATAPPTASAPATVPATPTPAPAIATVMAAAVRGHGTVLVAANGMTLYQFMQDTANSGRSACVGGCISIWPALTVPAGGSPAAAAGVPGKLGKFMRSDGGGTQVTYNGRPLYFYSGDSKPGDSNGNYPGWSVVPLGH